MTESRADRDAELWEFDPMSHEAPQNRTESDAAPESGPVSDRDAQDAREARLGLDLRQVLEDYDGAIRCASDWTTEQRHAALDRTMGHVRPLVARVAELEAEVDHHRQGHRNYKRLLREQCADYDEVVGELRRAEAERDALKHAVEEHSYEAGSARAEAAELRTALARVEALADEWASGGRTVGLEWNVPIGATFAAELRAALAAAGPAASDGEGATSEATRRATFAEVSRAMNRTANVWEDDGSDPCRVRITREYANAYRAYAEGLGEPTGSKGF